MTTNRADYMRAYVAENRPAIRAYKREWMRAKRAEARGEVYERTVVAIRYGLKGYRRGEDIATSKLSAIQVAEIRELLAKGMTQAAIGRLYDVSRQSISNIQNGHTWREAA